MYGIITPMATYELTLIFKPELTGEQVDAIIEKLDISVMNKSNWGKRLLAYPIKNLKEGTYIHAKVELKNGEGRKLDQALRLNENIIRSLVVKPD